jgi:hypothetical protein
MNLAIREQSTVMKEARFTTRLSGWSTIVLGLLLTGCCCFEPHEKSCVYSQYTRGLDDTAVVRMAELGILMRANDGFRTRNQNKAPAKLLEEGMQARERSCAKAEFDEQLKVFNEVLNRRIEGYKKEHEIYQAWLVPCVALRIENSQTTNRNCTLK